jgi:murein DD-endopeptidase MepM/ murein hydrolase activator NlpD
MIFCPLPGTPLITQGFGQNPDDYAPFNLKGHNGIDFGIPEGTKIYAPHDGVVTVKDSGDADYGLHVVIDDGKRRSILAHLSFCSLETGKPIAQGDLVGLSGKSGNATGPHLHWSFMFVQNGKVLHKDNGYNGAIDVSECTRLWLDQDLHYDAEYTDEAKEYLTMNFESNQYIKNPSRVA